MSFQHSEVKLAGGPSDKPALARPESLVHHRKTFDIVRLHGAVKHVSSMFFGGDIENIRDIKEKERQRNAILEHAAKGVREFVSKEATSVCFALGVVPEKGLSSQEAESRRTRVGWNELDKEDPPGFWRIFADQFKDILVWILIAAIIVSMAIGEWAAGITIIIIVLFNALLGVKMEMGAGAALEALQNSNPPVVSVRRDGQIKEIPSRELVPGDIVILNTGNKVPADIRLLKGAGITANEMQLTGESEPVKKDANYVLEDAGEGDAEDEKKEADRVASALSNKALPSLPGAHDRLKDLEPVAVKKGEPEEQEVAKPPDEKGEKKEKATTFKNMVYMGSAIQDGNGEGVVVHTAMKTEMGEIAHLLNTAEEGESPLQQKLDDMGEHLGYVSLFCSIVVFIIGVSTGRGGDAHEEQSIYLQMLLIAVALTVAAVPEALPVCVTICLAKGMKTMADVHQAQILKLKSVETLGSASVICTDKTGTLTKGEMTAVRLWVDGQTWKFSGTGFDPTGYCVPLETPTDEKSLSAAAERTKEGLHRMALLLAVLCSNATVQFNKTENKWESKGNSTERPLVVAGMKVAWDKSVVDKAFPKVKENAFSSARKMMSTLHSCSPSDEFVYFGDSRYVAIVKGAPNLILKKCSTIACSDQESKGRIATRPLDAKEKDDILQLIDDFSSQAFRVLAIAYQLFDTKPESDEPETLEAKLIFSSLICSIDPEREEVGPCIQKARDAGVRTVMITGDYVATAKAIAENIGIIPKGSPPSKAIDCEYLREMGDEEEKLNARLAELTAKKDPKKAAKDKAKAEKAKGIVDAPASDIELTELTTEELKEIEREMAEIKDKLKALESKLDKLTSEADVYARALPKDKITIVRSLQRQDNVCAMTGDGVNDAPALRQANIGVAMGITGTDVAKAAASMVLLNDSFVSIIAAIEQGRITYANIQKFVFFLLSCNIAEVWLILLAVILGLRSPLVPTQILWLNLTTDIFPALALAFEAIEPGVMEEGPRPVDEPFLEKVMLTGIFIQLFANLGTTLGTYIMGLYWFTDKWDGNVYIPPKGDPLRDAAIDARELAFKKAKTMVMVIIVLSELWRAYTVRSLRKSLWQVGPFSNKWMQPAVLSGAGLTILFATIPGLQSVFDLKDLDGREWGWIMGVSFVPFVVDEFTKFVYRMFNYGYRPPVRRTKKADEQTDHELAADDFKRADGPIPD